MNFMRLISQGPHPAFFNMALDEAISEAVRKKLSPPTLRVYSWESPALSIGYFQKVLDLDIGYCKSRGYPVVRRQTGGRAILHDEELTYSISVPSDCPPFNDSLLENYGIISKALMRSLSYTGITAAASCKKKNRSGRKTPACFKTVSFGEITVKGRKVIGSAQKRYKDGFLQHGSILIGFDAEELGRVTGCFAKDHFQDIGALKDHAPEISPLQLKTALKTAFEKELGLKMILDEPTRSEQMRAAELEKNKYSTPEWNSLR